jgi:molecular chaperone GrpE
MTAKPSADGAVTLSLIKARDELGHLLAQEKKQVAQLTAENQRLSHRVDKFKAGRDSVRERGQREREAALDAARDKLLKEFLPVLDNLERALDVELGESADELGAKVSGLLTGVEGVVQMFKSSLQKFGVTGFDSVGHPFDPNLHEAIRRVEDASVPNNHVVEEYHRGYLMGERLLRASLVVVATGGPRSDG